MKIDDFKGSRCWMYCTYRNPILVYPGLQCDFHLFHVFSFTFSQWVWQKKLWVLFYFFSKLLLFTRFWSFRFFCTTIERFTLTSSLSLNVIFFPLSEKLTRGLKLLFMAGSACWSVTKSDCEFLTYFFFPLVLLFLGFLWPGTRLGSSSTLECFHPVRTNLR